MNETIYIVAGGVGVLLVGIGVGYWAARLRVGRKAAKVEDVQKAFDTYRHDVTEHFGRTAEHFQAIGQQYRELYEHMATGADALCDQEVMDEKLSFSPAARIESLGDDVPPAGESARAPQDSAEGDGAGEIEQPAVESMAAEDGQAGDGDSETTASADDSIEKVGPETEPDAGGDDSRRTLH